MSDPSPSTPAPEPSGPSSSAAREASFPAPASSMAVTAASLPTPRLVTVNDVNWSSVLDFTHLFRGFRLAINPAKLAIALLAILLIYAAGRLFDAVWGPQADRNEMTSFVAMTKGDYADQRVRRLESRKDALEQLLRAEEGAISSKDRDSLKESPRAAYRTLANVYRDQFFKAVDSAAQMRAQTEKNPPDSTSQHSLFPVKTPAELERNERQAAAKTLLDKMTVLRKTVGFGIFDTFLAFESAQFNELVQDTLSLIRITPVRGAGAASDDANQAAISSGLVSVDSSRLWRSDTVVGCIANMAIAAPYWFFRGTAPMQWRPDDAGTWTGWFKMIAYHAIYFISALALAVFSLLLLAIAGASITRLSAMELAGIERAPLKDVFFFAFRRLWVFIKAPIMPLVIILAIGLVLAVVSMFGAIPFVGPIVIGVFFFVFLAVSFVLMLLLLGILGGYNLLCPTIAVEGADAFDAMSRSFAYVYSRPWRLLFYTIVSLVYGVLTFLFVSFAVYLILLLTHTFVGWGMDLFGAHDGAYTGSSALDTLWPPPQFFQPISPINWYAMSYAEWLGSLCLHFWVFLLITGIGAYVISYYFSSHTIIYLLLRRSVDGQHLREVYLEEPAK
jgi:hypothetical protein